MLHHLFAGIERMFENVDTISINVKNTKTMQKLILDYSKWRCGGHLEDQHKLGEGTCMMRNSKGYECCLGQFSLQLQPELTVDKIFGNGDPADVKVEIPYLNYSEEWNIFHNTKLSDEAININDDVKTSPQEKITLLKELFAKHDFEIEVINEPSLQTV